MSETSEDRVARLEARLDELEQTARGSWWWQQGWRDAQRWFWRRSSDGATLDPPHPLWRVPAGWRLLPPGSFPHLDEEEKR